MNQLNLEKALELEEKSLAIFREIGDLRRKAITLCSLGDVYKARDLDKAVEYYEMSKELAFKVGDPIEEVNALWKKCLTLKAADKISEAIPQAENALNICQTIKSPLTEVIIKELSSWQN